MKTMIHPDYNEKLNYPDLAVLELDIEYKLTYRLKFNLEQQKKEHTPYFG